MHSLLSSLVCPRASGGVPHRTIGARHRMPSPFRVHGKGQTRRWTNKAEYEMRFLRFRLNAILFSYNHSRLCLGIVLQWSPKKFHANFPLESVLPPRTTAITYRGELLDVLVLCAKRGESDLLRKLSDFRVRKHRRMTKELMNYVPAGRTVKWRIPILATREKPFSQGL